MPSFTITAQDDSGIEAITLAPGASRTIAFNVVNRTADALPCRLRDVTSRDVEATLRPAPPDWRQLEGDAVTEIEPGAQMAAAMKITVPANAAPGTYVFDFYAANDYDPDLDFARERIAIAVVPGAVQPQAKRFPLVPVAVGLAIVAALGGTLAYLLSGPDEQVAEAPASTTKPASETVNWDARPTLPVEITLYQHCDYGGYAVRLGAGAYMLGDLQQRGVRNDDISSVRVSDTARAILYEHEGKRGRSLLLRGSLPCLVDQRFNDILSSVEVLPK